MIKEHKGYLLGMLVAGLVGGTVLAFGKSTIDLPILIYIPLASLTAILICALIGVLILGVSWVSTKNFSLTRFIKITAVTCVIWTLTVILSTFKNMIL